MWANDIKLQFKKLLKTVINEYFNGLLKLHFQISKRRSYVSVCYPYVTRMPPYVTFMYVSLCNPCVTRVYPETIVRSCIRLKQTDRTSWTIQTHSLQTTTELDVERFMDRLCSSHEKFDVWPGPKPSRDV